MIIAVSGISRTLTLQQRLGIWNELEDRPDAHKLVTGGAYGVDTTAVLWASSEGLPVTIYVPRSLPWNRSLRGISGVEVIEVFGSYMDRNDAIADSDAEVLVAFPMSKREHLRSGTWATVRRFADRGKPSVVVALSQFRS